MNSKQTGETYFWRGRTKIPLEREDEFFTAIVESEQELRKLQSLPGVKDVRPVENRIYKVQVAPNQRDAAMERARSPEIGAICHHEYRPTDTTGTRYYLTDQVVVKFKAGVSRQSIESILANAGVRILKEYPGPPPSYLTQVMRDAEANPLKVANKLAELSEVDYAEPNLVNRFQAFYIPPDTYFTRQWHLHSWDGPEVVASASVSAPQAWDITRGSREIVVAVVDDGFDLSHPDFNGPDKVVQPKDYVDGDANPFPVTAE